MKKQLPKSTESGSTSTIFQSHVGDDDELEAEISCSKITVRHRKNNRHILATLTNPPARTQNRRRAPAHDQAVDGRSPSALDIALQPIVKVSAPLGSLDLEVLLLKHLFDGGVQSADVSNVNTNNYGDRARLDRWLLSAALDCLQRHKPTLQITRFLCVNLHAESINDAESIAETLDILRQHESVTSHLCLQISETTAQVSLKNLQHFLLLTQNMGAKVVLNDFGSGYNSLYFLKNLSADALRIDGHLIENMTENPKNMSIVEGIIQLARNLGMTSIATRVNDIRTLRLLIDLGVDYVQGSAIARPQQPDTVVDASSAGPFIEEAALATFAQAIADSDEQLMTSTPTFYKGNLH